MTVEEIIIKAIFFYSTNKTLKIVLKKCPISLHQNNVKIHAFVHHNMLHNTNYISLNEHNIICDGTYTSETSTIVMAWAITNGPRPDMGLWRMYKSRCCYWSRIELILYYVKLKETLTRLPQKRLFGHHSPPADASWAKY
jgi:hypothetical protein